MTATATTPPGTEVQRSGKDPTGRFILSVLAKRTYRIVEGGRCALDEKQVPLVTEPQPDPENPDLLLHDTDLYALKLMTDVVVKGYAYGNGQDVSGVAVRVGNHEKRILVTGDRSCTLTAAGKIVFSRPEAVEKVPLRYTHAYGGRDAVAETTYGNPYLELQPALDPEQCDLAKASPFLYPRNPCGRGYLIKAERDAVEALRLPNLEDPLDLLTPERLPVGEVEQWPRMPLPQATDWFDYAWFPRIAYFGVVPFFEPEGQPLAEVVRGFSPPYVAQERVPDADAAFRMTCGASLGLQLPHLRGDEEVELLNMSPTGRALRFRVPKERPRIWTDGRKGKLNKTEPVIHTVVIEPDASRLMIVWRGSAPALRPYLPDELEKMPFLVEWP